MQFGICQLRFDTMLDSQFAQREQFFQNVYIDIVPHEFFCNVEVQGVGSPAFNNIVVIRIYTIFLNKLLCKFTKEQFSFRSEYKNIGPRLAK